MRSHIGHVELLIRRIFSQENLIVVPLDDLVELGIELDDRAARRQRAPSEILEPGFG